MKTIIRNVSLVAAVALALGLTGCVADVLANVFFAIGPLLL